MLPTLARASVPRLYWPGGKGAEAGGSRNALLERGRDKFLKPNCESVQGKPPSLFSSLIKCSALILRGKKVLLGEDLKSAFCTHLLRPEIPRAGAWSPLGWNRRISPNFPESLRDPQKRQRCSDFPLRTNQVGACSFQQHLPLCGLRPWTMLLGLEKGGIQAPSSPHHVLSLSPGLKRELRM